MITARNLAQRYFGKALKTTPVLLTSHQGHNERCFGKFLKKAANVNDFSDTITVTVMKLSIKVVFGKISGYARFCDPNPRSQALEIMENLEKVANTVNVFMEASTEIFYW